MNKDLEYITEEEIQAIHDGIINATGGLKGNCEIGSLSYISESARSGFIAEQSLPGISAHLLARIAKGHPFSDGNKRTAYFAARYFLMKNGADFNGSSPEEASNEVEQIASQPAMDDAYNLAKRLTEKYIIETSPRIPDYETFYRLVIKSIGVAEILAKR